MKTSKKLVANAVAIAVAKLPFKKIMVAIQKVMATIMATAKATEKLLESLRFVWVVATVAIKTPLINKYMFMGICIGKVPHNTDMRIRVRARARGNQQKTTCFGGVPCS